MRCLAASNNVQVQPFRASFVLSPEGPESSLPTDTFAPVNGNFQKEAVQHQALRDFAMKFGGGPQGSKCCDPSRINDSQVEQLDRLAKAPGVRPMNSKEEKIFNEALELIGKAGGRSKKEAKFFAEVKAGMGAMSKVPGGIVVVPGMKDRFETSRDQTRMSANLLAYDDGTKAGHHKAVVITAMLLAHEWAHNDRGGKLKGHVPHQEGRIYPYLAGVEMGRLIKEMYEQGGGSQEQIAAVDECIQSHIDGGRSVGVNHDYETRDIRFHVPRKRH